MLPHVPKDAISIYNLAQNTKNNSYNVSIVAGKFDTGWKAHMRSHFHSTSPSTVKLVGSLTQGGKLV